MVANWLTLKQCDNRELSRICVTTRVLKGRRRKKSGKAREMVAHEGFGLMCWP